MPRLSPLVSRAIAPGAVVLSLFGAGTAGSVAAYSRHGRYLEAAASPTARNAVLGWDNVWWNARVGLPMVRYGGVADWNAVTVSQYGLDEYDAYLDGGHSRLANAVRAASWLVANQRPNGVWYYAMPFAYSNNLSVKPPWVAIQAQGQAISLLERIYDATRERRYLDAAELALAPFERAVGSAGSVDHYNGLLMLEGFPTRPGSYCLEDFNFAVLGLWDLATYSTRAAVLYRRFIDALYAALPLYVTNSGRLAYDLQFRTLPGTAPVLKDEATRANVAVLEIHLRHTPDAATSRLLDRLRTSDPALAGPGQ